jgi:hypothetical protein
MAKLEAIGRLLVESISIKYLCLLRVTSRAQIFCSKTILRNPLNVLDSHIHSLGKMFRIADYSAENW